MNPLHSFAVLFVLLATAPLVRDAEAHDDDFQCVNTEADPTWPDRWIRFINYRGPQLAKCRVIDVEPIEVLELEVG